MDDKMANAAENLLDILKEREKELNCLYQVDNILANHQLTLPEVFERIVRVLPSGWRFPELCQAKILYNNCSYQTPGFIVSPISDTCGIFVDDKAVGSIEVVYTEHVPETEEGYFLEKEKTLIKAVAYRIGQMISYRQMKSRMGSGLDPKAQQPVGSDWDLIMDFIRDADPALMKHICRKLTHYLMINGIKEVSEIFSGAAAEKDDDTAYANAPAIKEPLGDITIVCDKLFQIAEKSISGSELGSLVKKWIREEKAHSLIKAIQSTSPSLRNIIEEIRKLKHVMTDSDLRYSPKERWLNVGLISRLLSDRPEFVNVAKQYIDLNDFFDIINQIIHPVDSQGRLGGKSNGMILAKKILETESEFSPLLGTVKTPHTWYITTDAITEFLQYNNLEELNEQKYKDLQEVRIEYPNIVQLVKNSQLPPEIVRSLSVALDDLGDVPIIVRSSSTLEDQIGSAFSGKYKSLFLANTGTKKERLEALIDAILEVYASVYSPDPIQYRAERGLLDVHEEMGIMIQQVVGKRVGRYFFPLFSGVAFSNNEYRWSPRIRREDGLLRIVPGLGTRAVDRLSDDFSVLLSPGQPGIRVNIVPEEIRRYSPKKMDVIDLEEGVFKTVDVADILREYGDRIGNIEKVVSIAEYDHIRDANRFEIDFKRDDLIVTFNGIISRTKFVKQMAAMLNILKEKIGHPVDIEFASDGEDLYLLQCRPQSYSGDSAPASIPQDIPKENVIFSANRYISNGLIKNISHIVYVDPEHYGSLENPEDMKNTARLVGMLNAVLPKRQFILIGPGRWGSRGDIKLGVPVTYSEINNTAALMEMAVAKAGYVPELSFGTHFFQDLVEAGIRVLPLYPEDTNTVFNYRFLLKSRNMLAELFPEYRHLEDVVRVINVPEESDGLMLNVAMNADLGEALGYLARHAAEKPKKISRATLDDYHSDGNSWRWRFYMAEQLAAELDPDLYGVKAMYLIGSTSNGTARPGSDIDLLVHFDGTGEQKELFINWLDGWSQCLAKVNYLRTGYQSDGLLDVHFITDEDIRNKTSFAIKIDSVTEPAHKLKLKEKQGS